MVALEIQQEKLNDFEVILFVVDWMNYEKSVILIFNRICGNVLS